MRPLPSFPVIRDLVVDMTQFFKQYHSIRPYLINDEPPPEKERLQSPEEREKLDGRTSASCVGVARANARRPGGIRTSSSDRRDCCRQIVSSSTAAIAPPKSASTT